MKVDGRPWLPVFNKPHGFFGRKATLNQSITRRTEPRRDQKREVELGSHSWTDFLAADLFLNSCFSDAVFVTLFPTAVETATREVHKLFGTGGVPTSLTLLFWRWLHGGLFGLYWSERWDELFIGTRPPPPPLPCS